MLSEEVSPAGPLRSSGITRLHRYSGPIRHPPAVSPFPVRPGYRAYPASGDFPPGRGGFLQLREGSVCPCRRSHPAGARGRLSQAAPSRAAFADWLPARPPDLLSFEATYAFAHATARTLARRPKDGACRQASGVRLPSPLLPKLQGS